MLKLSSKATDFVAEAIREMPPSEKRARAIWSAQQAYENLTRDAAAVALTALQKAEERFQDELDGGFLGEGEEADIINDIEFIHAIQADLQRDLATAA
jgi:hypothetical protein